MVVANPMLDDEGDQEDHAHLKAFANPMLATTAGEKGIERTAIAGLADAAGATAAKTKEIEQFMEESDRFRCLKLLWGVASGAADNWSNAYLAYVWYVAGNVEWAWAALIISVVVALLLRRPRAQLRQRHRRGRDTRRGPYVPKVHLEAEDRARAWDEPRRRDASLSAIS